MNFYFMYSDCAPEKTEKSKNLMKNLTKSLLLRVLLDSLLIRQEGISPSPKETQKELLCTVDECRVIHDECCRSSF